MRRWLTVLAFVAALPGCTATAPKPTDGVYRPANPIQYPIP